MNIDREFLKKAPCLMFAAIMPSDKSKSLQHAAVSQYDTKQPHLLMSCLTESSEVWSIWNSCQLGGCGYRQGHLEVPMTIAPAAATLSAAALPIPVDAPVMSTTLPCMSCMGM